MPNGISHPLSIGRIHFKFMGCWVVSFNFIQISKVHSVSKQCRTGLDVSDLVTSDLVLHSLPLSHNKDARLKQASYYSDFCRISSLHILNFT